MRSTQKRRCRSNRGFTLVEMIVTMMLLSILLTISVMGLMAWQDWSDFNQANEYAETMFLAAQNQLSEYNATESALTTPPGNTLPSTTPRQVPIVHAGIAIDIAPYI